MFRLLFISALFVAIQGFPQGKIVGGKPSNIEKFPWQVAIEGIAVSNAFCAGSIISPNYILTAAHCVSGATAAFMQVRSGTNKTERGGYTTLVASYEEHPGYDYTTVDNDIAIIRLYEPIIFDETQHAVSLRKAEAAAGETAQIAGWGYTETGDTPDVLYSVSVPVVDFQTCNNSYGGVLTERMVCAGSTGKDSCLGDSGGALTVNNSQVGIISFGRGCGVAGFPGVYANVAAFVDFINGNSNNEADWV